MPSGILYGHRVSIGNYDQCIGTTIPLKHLGTFNGQYCLAHVYLSNITQNARRQDDNSDEEEDVEEPSPSLTIGVCIPAKCNPSETSELLTKLFNGGAVNLTNCSTKDLPPFRTIDWVAM